MTLLCSNCRLNDCKPPRPDAINGAVPIWCPKCSDDPDWFRLTPCQDNVLALLSDGKQRTVAEIADAVFVAREYAQWCLKELLELNLVARVTNKQRGTGHPGYLYARAPHPQAPFGEQRDGVSKEELSRG